MRQPVLARVILAGLAAPAAGQNGSGISVEIDGIARTPRQARHALQAAQASDFTVAPSVTSSSIGAGVRTLSLRIRCVDATGQIVPCNVVITHQPRAFSGGHNHHSAARPKGTFQPASGNTGTTGLVTTYTSPEVSGIIDTIVTGTLANGTPARLHDLAVQRVSFAFETTLASRSFAPWLRQLRASGYEMHMLFLWLPSADFAVDRVAERVRSGGHDVPPETVRRRYRAGLRNFFSLYQPLASTWALYDSSGPEPRLAAQSLESQR